MQHIRAVVFDLDDTLYPERQFVQSGFHAVSDFLQAHKIVQEDIYPALWQKFSMGIRGTIFNEALRALHRDDDALLIRQMVDVYRSHTPHISLYPDAAHILALCCARYATGLLSDGPAITQQNKIIALGIRSCFNAVMLTDTLGREFWKPHTAGYKNISAALGVPEETCLYVGDNPAKDFFGARKLGWATVRIRRPDGMYADVDVPDDHQADRHIESLEELKKMLV